MYQDINSVSKHSHTFMQITSNSKIKLIFSSFHVSRNIFSLRTPTCSPTPRACRMTPSPEPVTCGPRWSLLATPLLTVTPTRSPHPTARDLPAMEHQMAPHGALTQPSENFAKGELVRKRRSERKRATEHANSAKHKGAGVYLSGHPSHSCPYLV